MPPFPVERHSAVALESWNGPAWPASPGLEPVSRATRGAHVLRSHRASARLRTGRILKGQRTRERSALAAVRQLIERPAHFELGALDRPPVSDT